MNLYIIKYIIFISLLFNSCTFSKNEKKEDVIDYNNLNYLTKQVPKRFTVNLVAVNYTPYQTAILEYASEIIEDIFNSVEYRDIILSWKFYDEYRFAANRGYTNAELYDVLMKGAELTTPLANYQMDALVIMYQHNHRIVGFVHTALPIIYTNYYYHSNIGVCRIASNLVHEWTHLLGFNHPKSKKGSDVWNTVPYAHNTIIERLCPLAKEGLLTDVNLHL